MKPEDSLKQYQKVKRRMEIAQALREGLSYRQIREKYHCSSWSISSVKKCLNLYAEVVDMAPKKRSGRPPKLTMEDKLFIRDVYSKYPLISIQEVVALVEEILLIPGVSRHLISRVLKELEYSRKTVQRNAKQRDETLRAAFMIRIGGYVPDQLVFLDESAFNEHTTYQKKGWCQKGIPLIIQQDLKKSERVSLIAGLSYRGIVAQELIVGSYNAATFTEFITYKLLPVMNAYPLPNSVLVLDNCAIHNMETLRAACNTKGIRLVELPPYSPDFNPIEVSFAYIKRYLRTHYPASSIEDLLTNVQMAIEFSINVGRKSQACFHHAGYRYDAGAEQEYVWSYREFLDVADVADV